MLFSTCICASWLHFIFLQLLLEANCAYMTDDVLHYMKNLRSTSTEPQGRRMIDDSCQSRVFTTTEELLSAISGMSIPQVIALTTVHKRHQSNILHSIGQTTMRQAEVLNNASWQRKISISRRPLSWLLEWKQQSETPRRWRVQKLLSRT